MASSVQRATWARRRRIGSSASGGVVVGHTHRVGRMVRLAWDVDDDGARHRRARRHARPPGAPQRRRPRHAASASLDAQRAGGRGPGRSCSPARRRRSAPAPTSPGSRRASSPALLGAGAARLHASCRSRPSPPSTARRSAPAPSSPSPATCGWRRRRAASGSPPPASASSSTTGPSSAWPASSAGRSPGRCCWPPRPTTRRALHAAGAVHRLGDLDDGAALGPPAGRAGPADDRRPQAGPRALRPRRRSATTLVEAARRAAWAQRRRRRGPPGVPRQAPARFTGHRCSGSSPHSVPSTGSGAGAGG